MKSRALARPLVLGLALAGMAADLLPGRKRTRPTNPRRILIAHHLLLGDSLMVTALLAKCRAQWPQAEIVMTCPMAWAGLYVTKPYGVEAVGYDPAAVRTLLPLLRRRGFDLALVPGDNRLQWLARALDARWIVAFAGDSPAWKDWPGDELRAYPDTPMAWGDISALLVDGQAPAPFVGADWPQPPAAIFRLPPRPYVVLHVGASSILKQWPPQRWQAIGKRLTAAGYAVALSAGPGEAQLLDPIDPSGTWMRFAGSLTVPELWRLLADAALVVCPDTGVAHLARVVGVPAVVLYGPGSALLSGAGDFWRKSPYTAVTIDDFPCRDQHITMKREISWIRRCERFPGVGPGRCAEPKCMLGLAEAMVWAAISERLAHGSPEAA